MDIIYLLTGLLIGAAVVYFYEKLRFSVVKGIPEEEVNLLKEQLQNALFDKTRLDTSLKLSETNNNKLTEQVSQQNKSYLQLNSDYSSLKSNYANLQQKLDEHKAEVDNLQQKFTTEFKNIANDLLEDKSRKFTEQNKTNIDEILKPLSEKIKDFEKKVDFVYTTDNKDRAGLIEQIKALHTLNQQMSKDANNLTTALKGQAKVQGNWGEYILESILEKSGLVKDREYKIQESLTTEDGKRYQPDVIIYLPDNKCLIIDSKVSLVAYEKFCSSENDTERIINAKEHVTSVRRHILNLNSKSYQNLYNLKSLDFVLLFMPIEPAFSTAVQNEPGIFNEAFEKNIVIVSPSTLLATLMTIASIWRQENQNRNALEIARQSGALYDKFSGLVTDLIEMGKKMRTAQENYEDVMKKLHTGKGNLVNSVEKIKKLGAKATKSLPQAIIDRVEEDEVTEVIENL